MGFHYLNGSIIDKEVSHIESEALVYERRGNEDNLVAVEFLSTADPNGPAPSVLDHDTHPAPHLPFAHWELHVWCWKPNPRGLFADFNPDVECSAGLLLNIPSASFIDRPWSTQVRLLLP